MTKELFGFAPRKPIKKPPAGVSYGGRPTGAFAYFPALSLGKKTLGTTRPQTPRQPKTGWTGPFLHPGKFAQANVAKKLRPLHIGGPGDV